MSKRIIIFLLVVLLSTTASFLLNNYLLQINDAVLNFSLGAIFMFFAIAAILIYVIVEFVADKMPNQAGYAYLASMFLKIGFFFLIFHHYYYSNRRVREKVGHLLDTTFSGVSVSKESL